MSRIFITELPPWMTKEILIEKFSQFGTITDIKIIKSPTGKKRNFGFIGFFKKNSAEEAIKSPTACFIGHKKICIQKAQSKEISNVSQRLKKLQVRAKFVLENNLKKIEKKKNLETISSFGRIFVRNIPVPCSEDDIRNLLKPIGFIESIVFIKKNSQTKLCQSALISFGIPENAIRAAVLIDGKIFRGRILHVLNFSKILTKTVKKKTELLFSKFKRIVKFDEIKRKFNQRSWFTFFISPDKIIKNLLMKFGPTLKIFKNYQKIKLNLGKFAICEARIQNETRSVLKKQGIDIWTFNPNLMSKKSKRTLLIKNLSQQNIEFIRNTIKKFGKIIKFIYIPSANFSLIEFQKKKEASEAYLFLESYEEINQKNFIEWAPLNLKNNILTKIENQDKIKITLNANIKNKKTSFIKKNFHLVNFPNKFFFKNQYLNEKNKKNSGKILIRNIPFNIRLDDVRKIFSRTGKIVSIRIPKKNENQHRGFAFINYKNFDEAKKTVILSQNIHILNRHLSVKLLKEN